MEISWKVILKITKDNWNGGVQVEEMPNAGKYTDNMKWNKPLPMPELTIMPAEDAKDYVLENAGATLPKRDAVDKRITEQVRTGKIVVSPGCSATNYTIQASPCSVGLL